MGDQRVAERSQQPRHHGRVAGMAADLATDACGDEQHGVEAPGVLDLSLDELEDRGAGRGGNSQRIGHLAQRAEISIVVRTGHSEADRHSVPESWLAIVLAKYAKRSLWPGTD